MAADRNRLLTVLAPVVTDAGYDLEDIELSGAGRRTVLRILVDRDGGFGLDDVADLSRDVSSVLDDAPDLIPGTYVLEVSSPGVGRPLTLPRHWRRNVDRLVEVRFHDGTPALRGRIQSAGETSAVVDVDGTPREVDYAGVERATVQVELRRPRTAPASAASEELDDSDDSDDSNDSEDSNDMDDFDESGDCDDPAAGEGVRDGH